MSDTSVPWLDPLDGHPEAPGREFSATAAASPEARRQGSSSISVTSSSRANPSRRASCTSSLHGFSPNGIAVGPDGTIYVDTFWGNGYADRSAIASISPNGRSSRLLWQHVPPKNQ